MSPQRGVRTLGGMTPRFPWTTHLVAPVLIVAWAYLQWATGDGFQWVGWEYLDVVDTVAIHAVGLLFVAVPATLAEVVLLSQLRRHWPAQTVVVLFAGVAFAVSHFVAAFTLPGASRVVDGELAVIGLALYALYVVGQALVARRLVGLVPYRAGRPLDERPLLVRLGLVEPPGRP
jgi:hypothetical protein